MLYKKNSQEVIARLTDLYTGKGLDKIYAKMHIPNPILEKSKREYKGGRSEYPDIEERIAFWDNTLSIYSDLEDDSIPSAYLSEFDQGLYGALVGAEIRFLYNASRGTIASMVSPFVEDLDEVGDFKPDAENIWFKRYVKQVKLYADRAKNKFGVSHFILIDGLNFLMELRGGTNVYYDIVDVPEKVRFVMDFALKLNEWVVNHFFDITGLVNGGTCSNFVQWIPGRVVSESVDPFHLASVDTFEEWGREPVQRMFDKYDGGIVHLHSNGHHLMENVSTLRGLKCIVLLDEEFGTPVFVYKKLEQLNMKRGKIPLHVSIPYDVFADRLAKRELLTNVFYNVLNVPDMNCANKTMAEVKKYKI